MFDDDPDLYWRHLTVQNIKILTRFGTISQLDREYL